MPSERVRILSDLHFGDHASRVSRLAQLAPLLENVEHLVLNGDTLDTRPGPHPAHTDHCRAEVTEFFPAQVGRVTYLTGNHDADFSPDHRLDLADGRIFVTHGDLFFDDIVPWSHDAAFIGRRLAEEFRTLPVELHGQLDHRLALFRRVAAAIPQRHQAERNKLKYAFHYLTDTVWPPQRILRIMRAWQNAPRSAAEATRRYRPDARFVVSGHTHRPGVWQMPDGLRVINTGSFCPPLGGCCVDVSDETLTVRSIATRAGEFRVGATQATFRLAAV